MFDLYKNDLWSILLKSQGEISGLRQALVDGRVACYEGACACLVRTIANVKGCHYEQLVDFKPDSDRPAERWFMQIDKDMTPENSEVVKLTVEWIDEFVSYLPIKN